MVDFLRIDPDLLEIATQASRPLVQTSPKPAEIREWVEELPAREKDNLLTEVLDF